MQDVRDMLAKLGLKLSVLEATECLWEAVGKHDEFRVQIEEFCVSKKRGILFFSINDGIFW